MRKHQLKGLRLAENVFQLVVPDLSSTFPPLVSSDDPLHVLPSQPTALLGREKQVAEVAALLEEGTRLLTLTGPGGTGKTRVAVAVAERLVDRFEYGVAFVELAPIADPNFVLPTIGQTLGLRNAGGRPPLDSLKDHLRGKQLLLVLDNFEHVQGAAPSIADLLVGTTDVSIVVTSRVPLHLAWEREIPVPPLDLPKAAGSLPVSDAVTSPAVELFAQRARNVRPDFEIVDENAATVVEICRRVDGLPLAIELAAARLRVLSVDEILSRLEHRLSLLVDGARDLPNRQRTLRDTIGWSYNLLDETAMRLFRRLSIFAGGCKLDTIVAVCNAANDLDDDMLRPLSSLVDASLVRRDDDVVGERNLSIGLRHGSREITDVPPLTRSECRSSGGAG
jgi:predicted ATPase